MIAEKVADLNNPGMEVDFDRAEAEALGAIEETAMDAETARDSVADLSREVAEGA
ncbi:hypothetical protein ABWF67_11120 [Neisseria gonorrhoeae]|uniref:hypothetical protein n=1 Tax=Neisseria gonorrhoeae TaxID=485 RepID=UPI0034E97805